MIQPGDLHYVKCTIEHGGFPSERTFEIELYGGEKAVGTADAQYLRTSDGKPVDDDTPGFGECLEGYVVCRVVRVDDRNGRITVDVPSFDLIAVPEDTVSAGVPE